MRLSEEKTKPFKSLRYTGYLYLIITDTGCVLVIHFIIIIIIIIITIIVIYHKLEECVNA